MLRKTLILTAIFITSLLSFQRGVLSSTNILNCSKSLETSFNCEISGVEAFDDTLIFANDKKSDLSSQIFGFTYAQDPFFEIKIDNLNKIEDLAISDFFNTFVMTTAFDRIDLKTDKWDSFNVILGINKLQEIYKIADKSLRSRISEVLKADYFKIEGIEVLHNSILLGIREVGKSYKKFDYKMTILELPFDFIDEKIVLKNELPKIILNLEEKNLGISSLKYDPNKDILYILTSFESDTAEEMSFIYYCSLIDLMQKGEKSLKVLENGMGFPLRLNAKAEGITISGNNLIVVYDEDRDFRFRKNYEFRVSMIELTDFKDD